MTPGRWRQFTTRGLITTTVAAALVFAVQRAFGAGGTLLVAFLGALVAAHVLANAWGSSVPPARQTDAGAPPRWSRVVEQFPASRLSRAALFGRRWATVSGGCAAVCATAAVTGLWLSGWRIGPTGILLGGLSAAVIGGWGGFLAVSFADVARQAWKEATDPPAGSRLKRP